MASKKKPSSKAIMPVNNTVNRVSPQISAVAPGDFGLKAGFWDAKKPGAITFRPLLGWVSVTNYADAGRLPFAGVMLSSNDSPSMASSLPGFVGYFKNSVTVDDARKLIEQEGVRVGSIRGTSRPAE